MASAEDKAARRWFEDLGYFIANAEARGTGKGRGSRTHDLFGFVDFVAMRSATLKRPLVFVQATSRPNASTRWKKIRESYEASQLLKAGGTVALAAVGAAAPSTRGFIRKRPSVDVRIITLSDYCCQRVTGSGTRGPVSMKWGELNPFPTGGE